MSETHDVELVLDSHAVIGESPTWCAAQQALFWIDVKAPALHRFDPAGGADRFWRLPCEIGCFALTAKGERAVVGLRSGLFRLDLPSGDLTHLADPPYDPRTHRFNEGGCDPIGRFWLGTMFEPQQGSSAEQRPGRLYSYSPTEGLRPHEDVALTPNGMAWSPDGATMYFAHSKERRVFTFPFEAPIGRLGQRRPFVVIPEELGVPDGAAMDREGCYWIALHGGGRLRRYRPDGTLDREIVVPVSCPTMCAFCGSALDTLFITTASHGKSDEPHAGGLFSCRPGVRGLPRAPFFG